MSRASPLHLVASFAVGFVVATRAHIRVQAAKRKHALQSAATLKDEQRKSGQPDEVIALYEAIHKHEGFTRAGAQQAFAHLGQEETA